MTNETQEATVIQEIVVGGYVDYTTAKGNLHPQLKVLELKTLADGTQRVVIESKKGRPVEVTPDTLTVCSEPPAEKVKVPRVKKAHVYDRTTINASVKQDAEAGKTRLYPNRDKYKLGTSSAEDQRRTIDNDDRVANILRDVPLAQLYETAAEYIGADRAKALREKYEGKNIGMQRMNVGNVLRGYFRQVENPKPVKEPKPKKVKAEPAATDATQATTDATATGEPAAATESKSATKRKKAQKAKGEGGGQTPAEAKQAATA